MGIACISHYPAAEIRPARHDFVALVRGTAGSTSGPEPAFRSTWQPKIRWGAMQKEKKIAGPAWNASMFLLFEYPSRVLDRPSGGRSEISGVDVSVLKRRQGLDHLAGLLLGAAQLIELLQVEPEFCT